MQMPVLGCGVGEGPLCRERESREQGDGWCAGGVGVDITVLCINHGLGIRPVSLSRNSNKSHRDSNNTSHQLSHKMTLTMKIAMITKLTITTTIAPTIITKTMIHGLMNI